MYKSYCKDILNLYIILLCTHLYYLYQLNGNFETKLEFNDLVYP